MTVTIKVEGLKQLDQALGEFSKSLAKNVLIRVLRKAAVPIQKAAQLMAPKRTGRLRRSIVISTRLSRREGKRYKPESFAEVYIGPHGGIPYETFVEFGTDDTEAEPFMRPAWHQEGRNALEIVRNELADEIDKARVRALEKTKRYAKGAS
jgi:HK97 gp10 family phage protein